VQLPRSQGGPSQVAACANSSHRRCAAKTPAPSQETFVRREANGEPSQPSLRGRSATVNDAIFKTGIHHRDQLSLAKLQGFVGRRRLIAATLYPAVAASNDPDRDRILEHMLRRFRAPAATYRRTQSHRFEAFDAEVVAIIRSRLELDGGAVSVHDAAVSDGRTAVDFFRRLDRVDTIDLRFLATDVAPDLVSIRDRRERLTILMDPDSAEVVQVIRSPFVFNVPSSESALLYPLNRALLAVLMRARVPALAQRYSSDDPGLIVTPIRLLAPECLHLLDTNPRFRFERHDILAPMRERFHVVRAMNILNWSYFSEEMLRTAISHIHAGLLPNGLFVTGSNEDAGSPVDGGVYERLPDGFALVWASGAGSQIDTMVHQISTSLTDATA
jgi:hypothetical protein